MQCMFKATAPSPVMLIGRKYQRIPPIDISHTNCLSYYELFILPEFVKDFHSGKLNKDNIAMSAIPGALNGSNEMSIQ